MAIYMLVLFAAAVLTGLLFEKNTFCAFVCPGRSSAGGSTPASLRLVGVSRSGPSARRVKTSRAWRNRTFMPCKAGVVVWGWCPKRSTTTRPVYCAGQCLKACDRNNPGMDERPNPGWFTQAWAKDLFALKPLANAQVAFLLVVSGFVVYELFTE